MRWYKYAVFIFVWHSAAFLLTFSFWWHTGIACQTNRWQIQYGTSLIYYWLAWKFQVESPQMILAGSVCYFIFCLKVTYWEYLTLKYVLSEMLRILFSRHSIKSNILRLVITSVSAAKINFLLGWTSSTLTTWGHAPLGTPWKCFIWTSYEPK